MLFSWLVVRGSWFVSRVLASPIPAYSHSSQASSVARHCGALGERALPAALLPFRQRRAFVKRDMLFWNCGIVKMSHYGIGALGALGHWVLDIEIGYWIMATFSHFILPEADWSAICRQRRHQGVDDRVD